VSFRALKNLRSIRRVAKGGRLTLLACAAFILAGCSSETMAPQSAIWNGPSNARTVAATPIETGSASARRSAKTSSERGWGDYSGRRGQTEPPAEIDYAFKGDPNASPTFAAGPGQM
jgi:hypothetical protein